MFVDFRLAQHTVINLTSSSKACVNFFKPVMLFVPVFHDSGALDD